MALILCTIAYSLVVVLGATTVVEIVYANQ